MPLCTHNPRAKTVKRRMLPPANMSKKLKSEPPEEFMNSAHRVVLIPAPDVSAQTIHRQQAQLNNNRLRRSVRGKCCERFQEPHGFLRFPALLGGCADHLRRSASLLNLLQCRL